MGMLKGDFHVHINGDGAVNRWKYVQNMCTKAKKYGFNSVFLGCHDFVGSSFNQLVLEKFFMVPMPGAEITTTGGHILALNINYIPEECYADESNPADIFTVIESIHKIKGKCILAHPYKTTKAEYPTTVPIKEFIKLIDGAEISNLKHYSLYGQIDFNWITKWKHLKLFKTSDANMWEGGLMHPTYYTEIDEDWFN